MFEAVNKRRGVKVGPSGEPVGVLLEFEDTLELPEALALPLAERLKKLLSVAAGEAV